MANVKITDLAESTTIANSTYLVVDNGTTTKKATKQNLLKEVNSSINTKQDTLVSGTNIKTINSTSLLGSGDIVIASSNNYNDLTNKPQINNVTLSGSKTLNDIGAASIASVSLKQDTLVSGTNIKTINSTSLLGSGDITISTTPTYQTGEVLTGGTWVNGSPIYRGYFTLSGDYDNGTVLTTGVAQIINASGTHTTHSDRVTKKYWPDNDTSPLIYSDGTVIVSSRSNAQSDLICWIEYTKIV